MSFILKKQENYRQQRQVSQGAGITLVADSGGYYACFGCADKVATVLPASGLTDIGDGLLHDISYYHIPLSGMNVALKKLVTRYSVALVDFAHDSGGRFVLVYHIPSEAKTITFNPDEF